jgi:hypothetical protein
MAIPYNLYHKRSTQELRVMRSQRYNRLARIESKPMGYFLLREAKMLRQVIIAIDAVIEARRLQQPFDMS